MASQLATSRFTMHKSTVTTGGERTKDATCVVINGDYGKTSSEITVDHEEIPSFEDVRTKLLPLIKLDSWLKKTKELMQQVNGEAHGIFFQPINKTCRVDFGFVVVIETEEGEYNEYQYVLNSYLSAWHISMATLIQVSQANLRKRLIDQGSSIWRKRNTGIRYIQGLGPLAASVILLQDVIKKLDIQDGDPVAVIPTSDLCIIGGSQNVKQLCIMGEIALKFTKTANFISTQPLRLVEKDWKLYEPNRANDEHLFPRSCDEVKMLKRALKMQGKI